MSAVRQAGRQRFFALLFEALVMLLCREMPMAEVADTLGEHDTRLWRVAAHYVEAAHAKSCWAKVRRISVDETSARRGHRYVTKVLDTETHDLLLMVEGRSAEALEAFAHALVVHGGRAEQIALMPKIFARKNHPAFFFVWKETWGADSDLLATQPPAAGRTSGR
jgi:hypothetical protein